MIRRLRTVLFLILLASIAYQANAFYQYRKAAHFVPPHVPTVTARTGELQITLTGSGALQALETRSVGVREVQSRLTRIVADGAMVKAGEVVASLDTTPVMK